VAASAAPSTAMSAAQSLQRLPNGMLRRDSAGRVVDCNGAAERQLMLSRSQLLGLQAVSSGWQLLHADGRAMAEAETSGPAPAPLAEALAEALDRAVGQAAGEVIGVVAPDCRVHWLLVHTETVLDSDGQATGSISGLADLSEQRNQQALLSHVIDAAGLGLWQWDLRTSSMTCNDRLLEILGYRRGEIELNQHRWATLVHPDSRRAWREAMRQHLANPLLPCRAELRLRRPDGEWATVQSCGVVIERAPDGRPLRMAGIHTDLTEQLQMQAMLRHAARTDGLTQLPNRAAMFGRVQQAVERAAHQPDFGYAVLYMDFDRFKQVNDTLGHSAGDELLRQIAQRLRGALRRSDTVNATDSHLPPLPELPGLDEPWAGRIGGDEFVVLLEGVQHRDEACAVAQRLVEVLAAPYRIGSQLVHSSASIGIVTSAQAANDANTVMRDADTAMYEAKKAGRGRYMVYDPAMHERLARCAEIERDLRQALARQEMHVVYQPVVSLQTADTFGVEALLRWNHPLRGPVSPMEFIPVAEDSGLIVALGQFVLETACHQFAAWQRTLGRLAPSSMAVNLSPVQLHTTGLVADVQRCIADSGMAAQALQLEVTESLAAQDETACNRLREIKALGVRIALDDFGTGYSSLACLHLLPVDTVKIDRSFVSHAETSAYHRVLIEATIRVAQTLGMDTVAEGIETESQAALMRQLHCGHGQGFLWSRPLPPAALSEWATRRTAIAGTDEQAA